MKNQLVKSIATFLFLVGLFSFSTDLTAQVMLEGLLVNYQETPLGIDDDTPRFSWRMISRESRRGLQQTAYRLVIEDESGEVVWDSEKVASDISLGIAYGGKPLAATTRYHWTARVWTNDGEEIEADSWFETGLLKPDKELSGWDGATWIGGGDEDMVLYSHYLSVFKLQYQLQLDAASKSTKAAILLGGNDSRLMDKNLNLNAMQVGLDESYIALELDISALQAKEGPAKFHIYRVGYTAEDQADQPLQTFELSDALINAENCYDKHQFLLEMVCGVMNVYLGEVAPENRITQVDARGFNLNPYGFGHDFISYPMLADIGFWLQPNQHASIAELQIRHYRQPSNVIFQENLSGDTYNGIFTQVKVTDKAYQLHGGENGLFELANPSQNAAPMLRTTFTTTDKKIAKARIYATARGIYELYLNGERVSNDYFNPGLTQYNKTHLYQTYDVTDQVVQNGANALGAWLSEGWWSGFATFLGDNWNFFGDRQSLLAKLVITYADGTTQTITSEPETWQLYTDGPIRYGSFFQGEVYDARKEQAIQGWATPDYNASRWKAAQEVPLAGNAVIGTYNNFVGRPVTISYDEQQLIGQIGENAGIVKSLRPLSVNEVRPGVFVYDMGQNMVGFPKLTIKNGKAGDTIRIRYAEVLYPDLPEHAGDAGMVMLENIRAALTQDLYILKGGDEVIQPRFTFHGFRYMEITGIERALPLSAVRGQVVSSIEELASKYETSNELVNQLWSNITWSLRANFLSIPTDTPARNERMGWNGDINVFSRAATWLADVDPFLKRHMMAMRDMQAENGRFSDVAPIGNGFGGTLWGSAGIIVAWEVYQQFGDVDLLAEHYEAMKAYVAFLATQENEDGILVEGPLGDWLSPENGKNDNTMLWKAYQVYNLEIMSKVAGILGKEEDAAMFKRQFAEEKAFLNTTYFDEDSHKTIMSGVQVRSFGPPPANLPQKGDVMDTQASYAIPLAFGLVAPDHHRAAVNHLAEAIKRENTDDGGVVRPPYSLMTGFIGTASIGDALSKNGKTELAYELLQTETYPSWLYPVKNGATTIWERLNSYTIENGFGGNNSMNSFNHYSFGAIASWMYNYSLGIQRDPEYPGFKHFVLHPAPDPTGQMTFAKGYYNSMYGRIESEWKVEEKGTRYTFTVPANTTATLYLPAGKTANILEQGSDVSKVDGITDKGYEDGTRVMELASGSYEIFVGEE
jgi:alpha-L-rhamnosidase